MKISFKKTFHNAAPSCILCLDRRAVMCPEDIQRVTLRAGHRLFSQDHQKKRSHTDIARDVEEEPKRFRRDFVTEDDFIDNRISLAGKSI